MSSNRQSKSRNNIHAERDAKNFREFTLKKNIVKRIPDEPITIKKEDRPSKTMEISKSGDSPKLNINNSNISKPSTVKVNRMPELTKTAFNPKFNSNILSPTITKPKVNADVSLIPTTMPQLSNKQSQMQQLHTTMIKTLQNISAVKTMTNIETLTPNSTQSNFKTISNSPSASPFNISTKTIISTPSSTDNVETNAIPETKYEVPKLTKNRFTSFRH